MKRCHEESCQDKLIRAHAQLTEKFDALERRVLAALRYAQELEEQARRYAQLDREEQYAQILRDRAQAIRDALGVGKIL